MKKLVIICSVAVSVAFATPSPAQRSTEHHAADREIDQATEVMSRHTHSMGPHMKLSSLRDSNPADEERAQKIVTAVRQAIEKYRDPNAAEADNFRMFMPNHKNQKQYHFTNYGYALEASLHFNPEHPTSLLYEKDKKNGRLKLIGVMYTAPARYTEEELHERIPLSVSQWHQHVNLCIPPRDQRGEMFRPNARFGLMGSIATKESCEEAGGTFRPRIFGWMVHMYPFEKRPEAIWSVERQKNFMDAAHQH